MARHFETVDPARDPRMVLALFILAPIAIALAVVYAVMKPTPPAFLPLPIMAIAAVQVLVISRWIDRRQVSLDGSTLLVMAGYGKQEFAASDFDLDRARVLRLDEHPEWKPFVRTGGIALPGVSLGWFRTRTLMRLYCLLTDRQRVLVLPSRDGKQALLLSLKRPDDLLSALRDANDRNPRGR